MMMVNSIVGQWQYLVINRKCALLSKLNYIIIREVSAQLSALGAQPFWYVDIVVLDVSSQSSHNVSNAIYNERAS